MEERKEFFSVNMYFSGRKISQRFPGKFEALQRLNSAGKAESIDCSGKKYHPEANDLLVAKEKDGLTLYRYNSESHCFEKGPVGVKEFIPCKIGFVFLGLKKWQYQSFGTPAMYEMLGKPCEYENFFSGLLFRDTSYVLFQYLLAGWKKLYHFDWVNVNLYGVFKHKGMFVFAQRRDGLYDVLTGVGRLFVPRKFCILKTVVAEIGYGMVFAWDEKEQGFRKLYEGKDWMPALNLVMDYKDGLVKLYGVTPEGLKLLAEGEKLETKRDKTLVLGGKEFKLQKGRNLWYDFDV